MSALIVYYSFGGTTAKKALELSEQKPAELCEIKTLKKLGIFGAFFKGCPAAAKGKCMPIQPLSKDLNSYDDIVLMAPVWAGGAAPAINSALELLPAGKNVEVILVSGSGKSNSRDRMATVIADKGCTLTSFTDVKEPKE